MARSPHERVVQPHIEPGEVCPGQKRAAALGQPGFEPVQRLKQLGDGLVVGRLLGGEAGPVDAVVD
eukprot:scaffold30574_cov67-Isochrysis_galbana.AAC.1